MASDPWLNVVIQAVSGVVLWTLLMVLTKITFQQIRTVKAPVVARLQNFIIKIEAMRFLIRWGLVIALFAYEAYVLVQYLSWAEPEFYARHVRRIDSIFRHIRNAAIIVVAAVTLLKLSRLTGEWTLSRFVEAGSREDSERRARTLLSVVNGSISTVIVLIAAFMILDDFGIPITALLTGAGLAGLAVAFSAQSLLRDFFAGFFIILEGQYNIGDVVKIGDRTGTVERVTLRTTILRDDNGSLHIFPNSEIKIVNNMSSGWSAANVDFTIPLTNDADRIKDALEQTAADVANDSNVSGLLLAQPQVPGLVDVTGANGIYRITIRAQPGKQSTASQEIRRRALRALAKNGVQFPAA